MNSVPEKPKQTAFSVLIDQLGSEFLNAQEWNLFRLDNQIPDVLERQIITSLEQARRAGQSGDTGAEQTAFLEAKAAFCEAQRRRPWWYVANTRFGVLPLLLTAASGCLIYVALFSRFPNPDVTHSAIFWGFVGAVLKALYWLQFQINKGAMRPRWLAYFLVAPGIGVLFGAISSLIVKVGYKLFNAHDQTLLDWRVTALFAAFAGFNWDWALEKFRYSADAVAARVGDSKSSKAGQAN